MSIIQTDTEASSVKSVEWRTSENFPSIVDFMDLDNDHIAFRKFKRLNLYNLLFQQRQLAEIDEKIAGMRFDKGARGSLDYRELTEILPTLEPMLKTYDEALLRQDLLMKLIKTPESLIKSFKTFALELTELGQELNKGNGWEDLVSLGRTQKHWLRQFLGDRTHLQRLFEKPRSKEAKMECVLYSERKIQVVEKIIINLAFCIMVIVPLFVLSYLTSVTVKLLVITVAFFITAMIASFLSNNIENASLAVIAGYIAIFVVFLGSNPSRESKTDI